MGTGIVALPRSVGAAGRALEAGRVAVLAGLLGGVAALLADQSADAAGGKGVVFNTISVSDGISMGTPGMRYSLVSREVIADYMNELDVNPSQIHLTMELGSPESIKGAVEAGMGVSIISFATVQKELKLSTLVALTMEPVLQRPFSFVHQKQKFRHRAMDELLEFARNYCKSHPEVV